MRAFPSLILVLLSVCSIDAASLFAGSGLRVRASSKDVGSPRVIDATNGQLEIVNKIIAPDGFSRSTTLAGGTFPGPIISAKKGDDFSINVINNLNDSTMELPTTIHWHGIHQNRTNWADGVSSVTQCPIQPGQSFRYRFNAKNQTGTYWYHSHYELQYCDGLRGPMIIYDNDDPLRHMYDIDDENTVIFIGDWYHAVAKNVGSPFTPNATTINGKGRYSDGPLSPLSVINVERGKRYRFRIIGGSCDAMHNFTMDGHQMTIIEADGVEVEPVTVDWLQILAGQRYSVVVNANKPVSNYWIRAQPNQGNQTFINGMNMAILRYTGAPEVDPTTEQGQAVLHFEESHLHPLETIVPPGGHELGEADVVLNLVPGLNNQGFTVNGVQYKPPPTPVLLQILSGARHATELLPSGSIYELPKNKVIEVHMAANDLTPGGATGGPHGIHLHGHNFFVIRSATNSTPNFVNPLRRDTISMGSQAQHSNITFRFVTDNPGPWILHCHIDFHLHGGFAVVMAEAADLTALEQGYVAPSEWNDLCPVEIQARASFNTTSLDIAAFNATATSANASTVPTLFEEPNFSSTITQTVFSAILPTFTTLSVLL